MAEDAAGECDADITGVTGWDGRCADVPGRTRCTMDVEDVAGDCDADIAGVRGWDGCGADVWGRTRCTMGGGTCGDVDGAVRATGDRLSLATSRISALRHR